MSPKVEAKMKAKEMESMPKSKKAKAKKVKAPKRSKDYGSY